MAVWINEIHYGNAGPDLAEFIELAGMAGTDLSGWSLVLYDGDPASRSVYSTTALSGVIGNLANGFGTLSFGYPTDGIQDGNAAGNQPDGIALVNAASQMIQFLSYEGSFTAIGGPADGLASTNIGVLETGNDAAGGALALTGSGAQYGAFTWKPVAASPGGINPGQFFATDGADTLPGTANADSIGGLGGNDTLAGLAGDDTLLGGSGDDTLNGSTGNDSLDGGADNDRLIGGAGNDTLLGGAGNDGLDGGTGANSLVGGAGDDIYRNVTSADVVVELVNGGHDIVNAITSFTLGANIEALTLKAPGNADGTGNTLANAILGNAFDNLLHGLDGSDTINGNAGNDSIYGDAGNDLLLGGDGNDYLDGGTGNDTLRAGNGQDYIVGGTGADLMSGGAGNDTYEVDNAGDVVAELTGGGADTVIASVNYTLAANIENLTLVGANGLHGTGNSLANILTGTTGNDTLSGGHGNDTMSGGTGQDSLIGGANDNFLNGDAGNDTLDGAAGNDALGGGSGNDSILGGNGDDVLNGGAGNDTLIGGIGNDIFDVDSSGDVVVELAHGGTDTVHARMDYTLGDNLENLVMVGLGHTGTGNALNNVLRDEPLNGLDHGHTTLIGAGGDDTFYGTLGFEFDTLIGGTGNDSYHVWDAGNAIIEQAGEGIDTVIVDNVINYDMTSGVENLRLTSNFSVLNSGFFEINEFGAGHFVPGFDYIFEQGVVGTGNELDNAITGGDGSDTLYGNEGNDTLDGGGDGDMMVGGNGNDTYYIDLLNHHSLYSTGEDNPVDVVVEAVDGGIDTVVTALPTDHDYSLDDNVENLVLLGSADRSCDGNALDNAITGNAGNDTLQGFAGNDTLQGGAGANRLVGGDGDDTYGNVTADDTIIEAAGGGYDTVRAMLSFTLGETFEALVLTAAGAADGTGNAGDNSLLGNGFANLLQGLDGADSLGGGGGNDTLVGGLGADTLAGGTGQDVFRFGAAEEGGDAIIGYKGAEDTIEVSAAGFGGGLVLGMDLAATGHYTHNLIGDADGALGQFIYQTNTRILWWDADGIGGVDKLAIAGMASNNGWSGSEIQVIA